MARIIMQVGLPVIRFPRDLTWTAHPPRRTCNVMRCHAIDNDVFGELHTENMVVQTFHHAKVKPSKCQNSESWV